MTVWKRDVSITQNEDDTLVWGYASGTILSSSPVSFSGATAILTVNQTSDVNSGQLLRLTSAAGQITFSTMTLSVVLLGTIIVPFLSATSATLTPGEYYYDIIVTQSGLKTVYASGVFTINPSVSR